jgi:hypothetical protein
MCALALACGQGHDPEELTALTVEIVDGSGTVVACVGSAGEVVAR